MQKKQKSIKILTIITTITTVIVGVITLDTPDKISETCLAISACCTAAIFAANSMLKKINTSL